MRTTFVALYLTLLLAIGCTPQRVIDQLTLAESLCEEHPDSSLSLVGSIPNRRFHTKELRARHALLYCQALDKAYMDVDNDSLAAVAVNYYSKNGTPQQRATAYYYLGRVNENGGDLESCIVNFTLSAESVPKDSYYLTGLIYSHLGDIYFNQNNFQKSIECHFVAAEAFNNNNNKANQAASYSKLALNYNVTHQYDKGVEIYNKALDIYKEIGDINGILSRNISLAMIKEEQGVPCCKIKQDLFNILRQNNINEVPYTYYSYLSGLYAKMEQPDSSLFYLYKYLENKESDLQSLTFEKIRLYQISKFSGDFNNALVHHEELLNLVDSLHKFNQDHLIETVTEKYKSNLYQASLTKERQKKKFISLVAILLFVALLAAITTLYYIKKYILYRKEQEIKATNERIATLHEAQYNLQERYSILALELEHNNANDVEALNKIEETLFNINKLLKDVSTSKLKPSKFIDSFVATMSASANDKSAYLHLRYIANKKNYGVIDLLQERHHLTLFEVDLCSMICLGFSNETIRVLLNHENVQSIYNKRSRLRSKLGIDNRINIEDYIKENIESLSKNRRVVS